MIQRLKLTHLKPGDVLLFNRRSFYNWLIRIKTWSKYTHCEVVVRTSIGSGVFASRNGIGCGLYSYDLSGLSAVLRPIHPFDQNEALTWMLENDVHNQGYDYLGLLNFAYARRVGQDNGKMFCSEAAVRFLREGGVDLFPRNDADTISPRDFSLSPLLEWLWVEDNGGTYSCAK